MKCPICGKGVLKKGTVKETMFGVYLGEFPAEICTACNESFTDSETTQKIEDAAKKKGMFGSVNFKRPVESIMKDAKKELDSKF